MSLNDMCAIALSVSAFRLLTLSHNWEFLTKVALEECEYVSVLKYIFIFQ